MCIDWRGMELILQENTSIFMSPLSASFSILPAVMHRIESLLLAAHLISLQVGGIQDISLLVIKVLAAITTEECQEEHNLESLETLGDSFLKYAATQHLFKSHQSRHVGVLTLKRQRIICNAALWKLGCDRKITVNIHPYPCSGLASRFVH